MNNIAAALKQRKGFTLVELIVVIVVIGILAGLIMLGVTAYQRQARDALRQSGISTVTESLEKYYDKYGEYPSCAAMSKPAGTVATDLGIDQSSLKAPNSTVDNSFICSALGSTGNDQYSYVGDGSTACQTGAACLGWTIQYRSEETGEIVTISSRHTVDLATSGSLKLVATVVSDTQINLNWQAVPNALTYRVEQSRNVNMTGATTTTSTLPSSQATGLGAGTRYYFRVTPLQTGQSGTPDTANAITTIQAPSGTVATASSLQSSNTIARGSVTGGTCSSGSTLQYAIGYDDRNTAAAVAINYGAWATTATRDIAASQGYNYTFQTKARCVGPDATSSEVTSAATNVTRPINTPAAPAYTGDTTFAAGYRYTMNWSNSCPAGTSLVSGAVRAYTGGFGGNTGNNVVPGNGNYYYAPYPEWWYLGFSIGQVEMNLYYYAFYSCSTAFTTSAQSPTSTTWIYLYCEAGRRTTSANPRCDSYGQNPNTLPWGP